METLLQILIFGGLFFLMMRFGCGSHIMGHGSKKKEGSHSGGCCGGEEAKEPEARTDGNGHPRWVQPEEDRDPVCGKMVSKEVAKTSVHDGLAYYFCSANCRDAFEDSPLRYLGREGEETSLHLEQRPVEGGGH